MKTKNINIQPNGINQNRHPNFGITVKWTVWQHTKKPKPDVETRNITLMKQQIRKFIEHMPDAQKTELCAIMKALRNIQGVLEFNKPHPNNETLIQVFTINDNSKQCTLIRPALLDKPKHIGFWGSKFIKAIKNLLQPDAQVDTDRSIKLKELLKEFGISA